MVARSATGPRSAASWKSRKRLPSAGIARSHRTVFICEGVEIEDEVFIGHGVKFINDLYPHATTAEGNLQGEADWKVLRTVVRARASIGTNATILPNLSIGRGAMIGAAALVAADVPDHAIVAGAPARVIGDVREKEKPR